MDKPLTLKQAKSKFKTALEPPLVRKDIGSGLWTDIAMAFLLGVASGAAPPKNRNLSDTVLHVMQLGAGGVSQGLLQLARTTVKDVYPTES